jgi:hypothetical protein
MFIFNAVIQLLQLFKGIVGIRGTEQFGTTDPGIVTV